MAVPSAEKRHFEVRLPGGSALQGRDRRDRRPPGAAARPDGHPPQRGAGLAPACPGWRTRLVAYDARGHGESEPLPTRVLRVPELVADLEAVLAQLEIERSVLVGSSMGAATAMAFALAAPGRVRALVQITPAYDGAPRAEELDHWDALAEALDDGDVDAFVERSGVSRLPERFREGARLATRQRIERHRHLRRRGRRPAGGAALQRLRRPRAARGAGGAGARGGQPRRGRSRPPAGRRRGVRAPAAARGAGGRGAGQGAARLAGRAALARDRSGSSVSCRGPSPDARSSPPPPRPPSSPGSCPSTAARGRARPPARPGARSAGGCPRRPRRTGGMVISPVTGTGQRAMKSPSSAGAIPALPSSPATFTWTSTSGTGFASSFAQRGLGRDASGSAAPAAPRP